MKEKESEKKIRIEKIKKKIIDHLKEDMQEAKVGISRDKGLTKSVKNMK